ncbi:hypothetical protein VITFI_CDS1097 [Vitreoscilla filiformis]|uniref:DUF2946 domain-containing protein n=1 Tax=Vitreoscilla filiformis TaxID=63 RepID=A0A221KD19_VITFI|nr:DUF2946 family protein [Vitreoscilla filiformis]ASM76875.1 hypothetical protein VITFI_CDS1097 [Vitreoscilla filiformis]
MDDQVKAALRKWPNVPACRGWLGLDARGDWYMRDAAVQVAGAFPQAKGSRIQHDKLIAFIWRNYEADAQGAWFFQNGPQRVYVELEAAPWVWRLQARADGTVQALAPLGEDVAISEAWLDEAGRLFLLSPRGLGLVHSLDMLIAADALEQGQWPAPGTLTFAALRARFGYQLHPIPA